MRIRGFRPEDGESVVALWTACALVRPWNDPWLDIERKMADSPWGFLLAEDSTAIIGTVMAGYDGHRGWINYLACLPSHRRQGVGSALMTHAAELLRQKGCPKINLQVREGNEAALAFYASLGYQHEQVSSLGLRLRGDG
ncbi:MAG: GNAT family acetyltransferase [Actinomycetota bacterium]|nr:GNAT family acetyltransferase [Actinomycetota bacterium]